MLKKIIKNNEASSKIFAIIIIVVAVIIAGVYFILTTGEDPYWKDPIGGDISGDWGQEVILEYADGTLQSVKPMIDNPTLAVEHQGKEVNGFTWKLKGKASGTQSKVLIDVSGYMVKMKTIKYGTSTQVHSHDLRFSGVKEIDVDNAWHTVCNGGGSIGVIVPKSLADGKYRVFFDSMGIIKYKINNDWPIANNPDTVSLLFEKTTDSAGNLSITFEGEAGAS
jgi:hypothetical protein